MPVAQALKAWGRGARYAGSKDRAAVQDHVYDVLRCKGSCAALGGGSDGRALLVGLVRLQGTEPEAVFTGEGHAPAPLTAAEAALRAPAPLPETDVPDWLRPKYAAALGADTDPVFAALRARAPAYLRVNSLKADRASAQTTLARDGVETRAIPTTPTALEITAGARKLRTADAYENGLVEVQDLSVQQAVAWVDWPKNGPILDYCAGAGGKSLAIAARTHAALFAHDALPRRMADLPDRARRAGAKITQVPTDRLVPTGPFDAVLCDVPCSGSGTWRRDPEAKWRLTPERLADLVATQAQILQDAAALVAPEGRLVYMTCSLFPEENQQQVESFLETRADWTLTAQRLETPLTASDGFFTAILTKRPQS